MRLFTQAGLQHFLFSTLQLSEGARGLFVRSLVETSVAGGDIIFKEVHGTLVAAHCLAMGRPRTNRPCGGPLLSNGPPHALLVFR